MELPELAERALVNYLTGLLDANGAPAWPDSMLDSADNYRIFAGESEGRKGGQAILCIADNGPEEIPSSGNFRLPCEVWLRTPVAVAADPANPNMPAAPDPLVNHSAAADVLRGAIMANGLELMLTAAEAGFSVWGVVDRKAERHQTGEYWASGFSFKLVCCNL